MSLVELIAQADERGLAASGLGCLDRCVPLLGADAADDEALRPLWTSLAEGGDGWGERLAAARSALDRVPEGDAALLVRRMLDAAPDDSGAAELRGWADACSVAALQVHRMLDTTGAADAGTGVAARREGRTDGMSPLVAAELRRQTRILELLANGGAGGLRQALDVSVEGRRVLRAVVARRARGRG
ncbi:hypothetical protein [Streptomyces sp. VRA16 Mangrove soil]|uniref:hypothetical protein n=1 Tax=Streptomyces sp. VRA16 Mangrove soil TaxID=2817434 RepID=UPI001A9FB5FC|nr:hypothetical protein [Streptomyces sp. VRA16 Mangrove soil]MBO1334848.1 hypothetical protein [Streptomyces sp. VRA16 Mangrove soil]